MSAEANIEKNLSPAEGKNPIKNDVCLVSVQGGKSALKDRQVQGNVGSDGKSIDCSPIEYKKAQARDSRWICIDPNIDYVPGKNVEECQLKNTSPLRDTISRASSDVSALDSIAMYMAYVLDPGRPKLPAKDVPDELKGKIPQGATDKQVAQICLSEGNKYRQQLNLIVQTKGEANSDWSAIGDRVQKEINPGFDELVKLSQDSKFNHNNVLGKKAMEFATQHAEKVDDDCLVLMNKLEAWDKHRIGECEDNLPKPLESVIDSMQLPLSQVAERADKLMMWLKPDNQTHTASLDYDWPMTLRRIKNEAAYIDTNCNILEQAMKSQYTLDNNGIDTDLNKISKPNLSMLQKQEIANFMTEKRQSADVVTKAVMDGLEKPSTPAAPTSDQATRDYLTNRWVGFRGDVSGLLLYQNQLLQKEIKQLDVNKFDPVLAYSIYQRAAEFKHDSPLLEENRTKLHDVVGDYMADEAKKKH